MSRSLSQTRKLTKIKRTRSRAESAARQTADRRPPTTNR